MSTSTRRSRILAEIVSAARNYLRDFGTYFEVHNGRIDVMTFRLVHPNIDATTLQVYVTDTTTNPPTTTLTTDWTCDERNGLLKLTNAAFLNKDILISGYYYSWFTNSDLLFHAGHVVNDHLHNRDGLAIEGLRDVELDTISLGAVSRALNSLALELSLDIDVSTPEGIYIPAKQRYTQVVSMLQGFESKYLDRAANLNVGLGRIEQFNMRRKSLTTGRYVPQYRTREIDDHLPPQRLIPPTDPGLLDPPAEIGDTDIVEDLQDGLWPTHNDLAGVGDEVYGITGDGWYSIGTTG